MSKATPGSRREGRATRHAIGVMIADDRRRSRQGLRALLATQPEIEVVGEAGDGREALRLVEARRPDAILMDAQMPTMDGVTATRLIKANWPEVKVIVLTMCGSHRDQAFVAGADAFLVKGCPAQELLRTLLDLQEGD